MASHDPATKGLIPEKKKRKTPFVIPTFTEPHVFALTSVPSGQTGALYLRLDQSAPMTAAGTSASWNIFDSGDVYSGANSRNLSPVPKGGTQDEGTIATTKQMGGTRAYGMAVFTSPGLVAQVVASGNYKVAFAMHEAQTSGTGTGTWGGMAALFHVRAGTKITTIFDVTNIGSTGRATGSTEYTVYNSFVSGNAFTLLTGDYLQLEIGIQNVVTGEVVGWYASLNLDTGGATSITSDAATTTDALSLLGLPTNVVVIDQATTYLQSQSTLTAASVANRAAISALKPSSKLIATSNATRGAATNLLGNAKLTATGSRTVRAAANLQSIAKTTFAGIRNVAGTSRLLSLAAVTLTSINYVSGKSSLSGRVVTNAGSTNTSTGSAALTVRITVTPTSLNYNLAVASLTSRPSMAAVGTNSVQGAANLAARSVAASPSSVKHAGVAPLRAATTSSMSPMGVHSAVSSLRAAVNVGASSSATHNAVSTIGMRSVLVGSAAATHNAKAVLSTKPIVSGDTTTFKYGAASLAAKSLLSSTATKTASAVAGLHGVTSITAAGVRKYQASASLLSRTTLIGASGHIANATVSMQARPVLTTTGLRKAGASLSVQAISIAAATAAVTHNASASLVTTSNAFVGSAGGAQIRIKSTLTAKALETYGANAILTVSTSLVASAKSTFRAIAPLRAASTLGGSPSKQASGSSSLSAAATVHAAPHFFDTGSVTIRSLSSVSAQGTKLTNISGSGGVIVSGGAKIESPLYNYYPTIDDTYIAFTGQAVTSQGWVFVGSGDIGFTGQAPFQVGYRSVGQGSFSIYGEQTGSPVQFYTVGTGFYWRVNESATATIDFYWAVGQQRQYWWRVIGQGRNDVCPPIGGDDCCKTFLMTIQARTVDEVCAKIKARFGVWPIKSIQRFSKPAESAAVAADLLDGITYDCNQLIDVPYCNVPQCAAFCVEYDVKEYWGTYDFATTVSVVEFVHALSVEAFSHEGGGSVGFGGSAVVKLHVNAQQPKRQIRFGGTASVRSDHYRYEAKGSFSIIGSANRGASHWSHQAGRWAVTKEVPFRIDQSGYGTGWNVGNMFTNDMSDGTSRMLIFTDLQIPECDGRLSGLIVRFDRYANCPMRDAEVVTMSGEKTLRTLTNPYDWPIAIPVTATHGSGTDTLGYEPGKPFAIGIRVRSQTIKEGLIAKVSNPRIEVVYDSGGRVRIGGSAKFRTSFWKHQPEGGVVIGGSARCELKKRKNKLTAPMYSIEYQPEIAIQGISKEKIKPPKELLVRALGTTTTSTTITSIGQAVVPTLTSPTGTIDECLCTGMPLVLPFAQNISYSNKLSQFGLRNGITIPQYVNLEHSTLNDSWQANLYYFGNSASAINNETWSMVFEFKCTDMLGAVAIGRKVWRFAMKIRQRNSLTGESLETRFVVAFLPDPICSVGKQFRFKLTLDTQLLLATIDPTSTIYELVTYDGIGLFKTSDWIAKPNLVIDMSNSGIVSPVPRYPLYIESNS